MCDRGGDTTEGLKKGWQSERRERRKGEQEWEEEEMKMRGGMRTAASGGWQDRGKGD